MSSPPKKSKKSLETPAFSPILTDFSVFFRAFAVFSLLLCLVLPYFCAVFALSTSVFSSFLLYSAIPFQFFHGFFTVFGSFFPLFSHFSPFKVSAAPRARFFGACGFFWLSFGFFRYSRAVFALRSPVSTSKIYLFVRFFAFFFCFFACMIVFRTFFCFFPAIVGICRGKIENSPFSFIKQ